MLFDLYLAKKFYKSILEMKLSSVFFLLELLLISNSYFLDLSTFLSPSLGYDDEFADVNQFKDNEQDNYQSTQSFQRGKSKKLKKNHKGPNKSSKQWYGRKKNQRYNLRKEDFIAHDLYRQIGIPTEVIQKKIIPIHMEVRFRLNSYFYKGSNSKKKLYASLLHLKKIIDQIIQNYLHDINNLIIGQDNIVIGSNIMMIANNHKVLGKHNFVFNNQHQDDVLKGNNIVRIDRFDINLGKINRVLVNPYDAVVLLDQ